MADLPDPPKSKSVQAGRRALGVYVSAFKPVQHSEAERLVEALYKAIPGFMGDWLRVIDNLPQPVRTAPAPPSSAEVQATPEAPAAAATDPVAITDPFPAREVSGRDRMAQVAENLARGWVALKPEQQRDFLVNECAAQLASLPLSPEEMVLYILRQVMADWKLPGSPDGLVWHLRRFLEDTPPESRRDLWYEALLALPEFLWRDLQRDLNWFAVVYLHEILMQSAVEPVSAEVFNRAARLMSEILRAFEKQLSRPPLDALHYRLAILSVSGAVPPDVPDALQIDRLPSEWRLAVIAAAQGSVADELFPATPRAAFWLRLAAVFALDAMEHYSQMVATAVLAARSFGKTPSPICRALAAFALYRAVDKCGGVASELARDSLAGLLAILDAKVPSEVLRGVARIYHRVVRAFDSDVDGRERWCWVQRPAVQALWRAPNPPDESGTGTVLEEVDTICRALMGENSFSSCSGGEQREKVAKKWAAGDEMEGKYAVAALMKILSGQPAVSSVLVDQIYLGKEAEGIRKSGPLFGSAWAEESNWSVIHGNSKPIRSEIGPHAIKKIFESLYG